VRPERFSSARSDKSGILLALGLFANGDDMADLDAVLEQLKTERKRAEGELRELQKVIAALSRAKMKSLSTSPGSGKRMKQRLSEAARERIAAAQRVRWAKVREKSKKTS
jgi:hypothetical protein